MKRSLARLSIPFRQPFATATGVVAERELLLLRLEDEDGTVGFGEAAPFEPYDGCPVSAVIDALRGGDGPPEAAAPPQAHAAYELALLDLQARRDGRAVGDPGAEAIAVNRTLPAGPPTEVADRAAAGVKEGFSCFKLKVGLPDDVERVRAVRAAIGPWPALRIDANGVWSTDQAVETLEELADFDIQVVEQPCATLEELAEVKRRSTVPVAADESIRTPDDVRKAAALGACHAVNVKLASSGGFGAARETMRMAIGNGMTPYLSSTLDGPWGIAAALQLAASERLVMACGLATLELFDADIARCLPGPVAGLLAVPQGPGLGVAVDDAALAEVLVEELDE